MTQELGIWEIAVLALLREAPMHPYQMRRLLKDRHKDELLALKKGSMYHAIGRLERAGLIEVDGTSRDGRRPERTTYRVAAAGIECLLGELQRIVATPKTESSEFMAAMSFLVYLSPEDAVQRLAERCRRLQNQVAAVSAGLVAASAFVDRINLVENEYLLATLNAELAWVRGLEQDIRLGKLTWNTEAILDAAKASRVAAAYGKD